MDEYLRRTDVIDWDTPAIQALAMSLEKEESKTKTAERCFNWVRDDISHSFDVQVRDISCSASSTLQNGTGICYAKTHLLAALLRANSIPTGFGYQRIVLDEAGTAFCLHAFNFIWLEPFGWYAADPRGDREGISTVFDPPNVALAFPANLPGEKTFETNFADPLPSVVDCLNGCSTIRELRTHLPDLGD